MNTQIQRKAKRVASDPLWWLHVSLENHSKSTKPKEFLLELPKPKTQLQSSIGPPTAD